MVEDLTPQEEFARRSAEIAAEKIARIHRKRLVIQSFLAAFVASSLIALGVVHVVTNRQAATQRSNAQFNCELFSDVAGVIQASAEQGAKDKAGALTTAQKEQVLLDFQKILPGLNIKALNAKQQKLDKRTLHFQKTYTIPHLKADASTNCIAAIR